ncbi:MAG: hypothetical protein ACRED5_10605 [Propylenella sp.]
MAQPGKTRPTRLFFLHIPKTAGSSVNYFFANVVGHDNSLLHLESQLSVMNDTSTDAFRRVRFASGHLSLQFIHEHFDLNSWVTMTVLRNPIDQIGSHLRWLKYVGSKPGSPLMQGHTPLIQHMAARLNKISLNDTAAMQTLFFDEFPQARLLFDNCQVRYLLPVCAGPVDQEMANRAIQAIKNIDYVISVEGLRAGLLSVLTGMGWSHSGQAGIGRENSGQIVEPLNLQDSVVREFYGQLVKWDVQLYSSMFAKPTAGWEEFAGHADRTRSASYSR